MFLGGSDEPPVIPVGPEDTPVHAFFLSPLLFAGPGERPWDPYDRKIAEIVVGDGEGVLLVGGGCLQAPWPALRRAEDAN